MKNSIATTSIFSLSNIKKPQNALEVFQMVNRGILKILKLVYLICKFIVLSPLLAWANILDDDFDSVYRDKYTALDVAPIIITYILSPCVFLIMALKIVCLTIKAVFLAPWFIYNRVLMLISKHEKQFTKFKTFMLGSSE